MTVNHLGDDLAQFSAGIECNRLADVGGGNYNDTIFTSSYSNAGGQGTGIPGSPLFCMYGGLDTSTVKFMPVTEAPLWTVQTPSGTTSTCTFSGQN